jgi:hypothetical protein
MDIIKITGEILDVINQWEPKLSSLPEDVISERRNSQNRTIKEILGHLVDSASNNHQRMVRLQYNPMLDFPDYQQDNDLWIRLQDYQHAEWHDLTGLWKYYNLHIIRVMRSVNQESLSHTWENFQGNTITLQQMIEGYIEHTHLHLNEIQELINSR